jgi:hypothetical protein
VIIWAAISWCSAGPIITSNVQITYCQWLRGHFRKLGASYAQDVIS